MEPESPWHRTSCTDHHAKSIWSPGTKTGGSIWDQTHGSHRRRVALLRPPGDEQQRLKSILTAFWGGAGDDESEPPLNVLGAAEDQHATSPVSLLAIGSEDCARPDNSWFSHNAKPATCWFPSSHRQPNVPETKTTVAAANVSSEDEWSYRESPNTAFKPWPKGQASIAPPPYQIPAEPPTLAQLEAQYAMVTHELEINKLKHKMLSREKLRLADLLEVAKRQNASRQKCKEKFPFDFPDPPRSSAGRFAQRRVLSEKLGTNNGEQSKPLITPKLGTSRFPFLTCNAAIPSESGQDAAENNSLVNKDQEEELEQSSEPESPLEILKAPPTSLNYGKVCALSRSELAQRVAKADDSNQKRLFLPGRGWVSKLKLRQELLGRNVPEAGD